MRHLPLLLCSLPLFAAPSRAQEPKPAMPLQPAPAATAPAAAKKPAADPAALIGKPPPPFTVAKWVKGEPVAKLETGKVYLVDFWATWCGPCKAAIPHLTRLQHEHAGKLEVIGVSISERQKTPDDIDYIDRVQQFVDGQGERMDYRVAVDTADKQMHAAWFQPTGTGGIPTAYVIDQKGLVAWVGIGAPKDLERITGEVLAGTFDPKAEAARKQKEEAEAKQRAEADVKSAQAKGPRPDDKFPGFREAMERGDPGAALAVLDQVFAADPAAEKAGYQRKFMLLLQHKQPADAEAYGRELLRKFATDDDMIGFASAVLVHCDEGTPRFDAALAHELAEKTLAAAKPDSRWQQFARWRMGWAQFHTGKQDAAIATMQQAREAIGRLKETIDFDDLPMHCEDALRVFRKPAK
jgi:thiol-disulfide isomerase/thioredoxin